MRRNLLILKYLFKAFCNRFQEKRFVKKLEFVFVSFLFFSAYLGVIIFLYLRESVLFQIYGELLFLVFIRTQLIILSSLALLMHLIITLKPYTENIPLELASQLPLTLWDRLSFRMLGFFYESKRFFFLFFYILVSSLFIAGKLTIVTTIVFGIALIATYILYIALALLGRVFIKRISNTFFRQNILVLTFFVSIIFLLILFVSMLYSPFKLNLAKHLTFVYYWPTSWLLNIVNSIAINNLTNCVKFSLILFSVTGIVFTLLYFLEKRAYLSVDEKYFAPLYKDGMIGSGISEKILGNQRAAFLKKEQLSIMRTPFFYMFFAMLIALFIFLGIVLKSIGKNIGDFFHAAYLFYTPITVCIVAMSLEELLIFRFFNSEVKLIKQLPISYHDYIFMKILNSTFITIFLSEIPVFISGIISGFPYSQILSYMTLVLLLSVVINMLLISILITDIPSTYIIRTFRKWVLMTGFLLSFFIFKMFISYSKIYVIFFPLWIMVGFACLIKGIKRLDKVVMTS